MTNRTCFICRNGAKVDYVIDAVTGIGVCGGCKASADADNAWVAKKIEMVDAAQAAGRAARNAAWSAAIAAKDAAWECKDREEATMWRKAADAWMTISVAN